MRQPRFALGRAALEPDPSGALWWPAEHTLLVADLHLEKGTSFAARGVLLPPYDTAATLGRLEAAVARYRPRRVVALGDSFHDAQGRQRLDPADRARLDRLLADCDWVWLDGNHDPAAPGAARLEFQHLGVTCRHEALRGERGLEISGHFHPKASIRVHGRAVTCRCFVEDGTRLVMPAFGAYAGGLDIRDPAIASLFPHGFTAHLAGTRRILSMPSSLFALPPLELAL
jgi:hypothetical protein